MKSKQQELDELKICYINELEKQIDIWCQLEHFRCLNRVHAVSVGNIKKAIGKKIDEVDEENLQKELTLGI